MKEKMFASVCRTSFFIQCRTVREAESLPVNKQITESICFLFQFTTIP